MAAVYSIIFFFSHSDPPFEIAVTLKKSYPAKIPQCICNAEMAFKTHNMKFNSETSTINVL